MVQKTLDSDLAMQFALQAHEHDASEDETLSVEKIIAAILSDKHSLSAEELMVFENVLDAPDMDAESRQELLQAIWNIVVTLIDRECERHFRTARENQCGKVSENQIDNASDVPAMVSSKGMKLAKRQNAVAADRQRRGEDNGNNE